jgi:hypothetical protein
MTRPTKYLLGTIVIGILVLLLCARLLRQQVGTNPFDQAAPAASAPQ